MLIIAFTNIKYCQASLESAIPSSWKRHSVTVMLASVAGGCIGFQSCLSGFRKLSFSLIVSWLTFCTGVQRNECVLSSSQKCTSLCQLLIRFKCSLPLGDLFVLLVHAVVSQISIFKESFSFLTDFPHSSKVKDILNAILLKKCCGHETALQYLSTYCRYHLLSLQCRYLLFRQTADIWNISHAT